jgi:hypothetical protein
LIPNNTRQARRPVRRRAKIVGLTACALLALPGAGAMAAGGGIGTGGDDPTVAGERAKLKRNGQAVAPASAPQRVKDAIAAANRIEDKPYKWGGGHGSWRDSGYDCSGAVSYALGKPGARIVKSPMPSGSYARWGKPGKGKWITVYANGGHMFVVIAGLRWDTSMPDDGNRGPGWSKDVKAGFRNVSRKDARHWRGGL